MGYVSYQEQWLDSTGPFKDVMISMFATLAKQERARISERTIAGLKVARAKGKRVGRMPLPEETVRTVLSLNQDAGIGAPFCRITSFSYSGRLDIELRDWSLAGLRKPPAARLN